MDGLSPNDFTPEEVEFFSEDVQTTIIPNFALPPSQQNLVQCIENQYGPLHPNIPVQVPLWLALALNKRKKCRFQPPAWLLPDNLQEVIDQERGSGEFQELPFHYIEIAKLMLKHAQESFADDFYKARVTAAQVKDLVETLRQLRFTKLETGLRFLTGPMTPQLRNLSAMECNVIRPLLQKTLDQYYKLSMMEPPSADNSQAMPSAQLPSRHLRD